MDIKKWYENNVNFRREESEVRDNKGYAYTLGAAGLIAGAATGVIVVILQTVLEGVSGSQSAADYVASAIVAALLAYMIWLLLPMYKDGGISIVSKITTTLIAIACVIIPFIIGVYIIVLAVFAIVLLVALWVLGKMFGSSQKASREGSDLIETMMGLGGRKGSKSNYDTIDSEDGTLHGDRIDKDTFSANGTTYKRTYEGAAEVWKEE